MPKRVILCFDRNEENEINALKRRIQIREMEKGVEISLADIPIIYPADISSEEYMTWTGTEPSAIDREILYSLQPGDKIYIWGHGLPNSGYMPGAYYTEVGDYLEKSLNKNNFSPATGALSINIESCNGARGLELGNNSFAARLHSYLGKIGVFSMVTGRLHNLWFDTELLADEGLKTVDRGYYGLKSAGFSIAESRFKNQAPRSKATFKWDRKDFKQQIRVDSYRHGLKNSFLRLKYNILTKVNEPDGKLLDPRMLHKLLIKVEFLLDQDDKPLAVNLLKSSTEELYRYCEQIIGFDNQQLTALGFTHFHTVLLKKAHPDGLIREKTGHSRLDPKLPIEEKSLGDVIADLPSFKKLDDIVTKLHAQHKHPDELFEVLGSRETCGQANHYGNFFTIIRKHLMQEHNGQTDLPPKIIEPMNLVNRMLETVFIDDSKSFKQKKAIFDELKAKLDVYLNPSFIDRLTAWAAGMAFGFKIAYRERYESSVLEFLPNLIFSTFNWRNYYIWCFSGCEEIKEITDLCAAGLSHGTINYPSSNINSFYTSKPQKKHAVDEISLTSDDKNDEDREPKVENDIT